MEKTYQSTSEPRIIDDEVTLHKKALFDKYVTPHLNMIYKLCMNYTYDADNIQDNYTEVLANMYKYIDTYDPERSIQTWIHIVTKRYVFNKDERRKHYQDMWNHDDEADTFTNGEWEEDDGEEHISHKAMNIDNYQELYNDDILWALNQLKPSYKRSLLLQQAGYKLREIAEIEYQNGALDSRNIETVKSRLFLARQQLQQLLTRDGNRRTTEETD